MSAESDEAELWARALALDPAAFRALFLRHRDRVLRHALRMTESRADAEDVAAAAFLELWRLRQRVRVVGGSVLPWLLVTTTNLARNQRRGLLRHRAALRRLPRPAPERAADEAAELRLEGRRLRDLLRGLSPDDAALLVLTAVEGCSGAEAAAVLGISAGTARNRLVRIRRRLRMDLAPLREHEGLGRSAP